MEYNIFLAMLYRAYRNTKMLIAELIMSSITVAGSASCGFRIVAGPILQTVIALSGRHVNNDVTLT